RPQLQKNAQSRRRPSQIALIPVRSQRQPLFLSPKSCSCLVAAAATGLFRQSRKTILSLLPSYTRADNRSLPNPVVTAVPKPNTKKARRWRSGTGRRCTSLT
ncbi:unnamed protein product, partial [Ectocarpus sp. 6 AP-2014]